jgi:ABC-2 type transport system permease protein
MTTYFFGDTAALTGRTLRHVTRSLDTIITTAIMPIAIMLMFVYVFGGAIDTGSDSVCELHAARHPAHHDRVGRRLHRVSAVHGHESGIFERFQSMPIARSGLLWAHVLTSLVANLISLVVVVVALCSWGSAPGRECWRGSRSPGS